MTKTQAKRLLNVAKALRESPAPKMFTMEQYVYGQIYNPIKAAPEFCGTPACALGHYAARGDLQRLLKVVVSKIGPSFFCPKDTPVAYMAFTTPPLRGARASASYDDDAVRSHFGLSWDDSEAIFGNVGCNEAKTPKAAARYIERFVAKKQARP